jgi:FAD/FMN-containing dehydrogenase
VWTHYLKGFDFLPNYSQPGGNYTGPAAVVGAGLQVWEAFAHAERHNVTLVSASCLTVGSYGGWITGGGHSPLSSKFGLGVDQVLELRVVTADGRYVTADAQTNRDLFFALRGGGGSRSMPSALTVLNTKLTRPGTYGIITSAIVKAHPQINLTIASFTFALGNTTSTTPGPSVTVADANVFWKGFNEVYAFGIPTIDAGGYLWTTANSNQMQVQVQMPGLTPAEATTFVQPLIRTLNNLGIPVAITTPPTTQVYSSQTGSHGGSPGNSYFASRLFPRAVFENATLFAAAMTAARAAVEAGYRFHGLNMAPTVKAGGYAAPAGVNPVWRDVAMHADVFTTVNMGALSPTEAAAEQRRLNGYMDALRAATPGGGAYFNECDVLEPDWQTSFFGSNYGRLVRIKRDWDPWHVFWAPTTPGSVAWAVQTPPDELPTQNGRLCRV